MSSIGSFIASFLKRSDTGTGREPQQDYRVTNPVALAERSRKVRLRRQARHFERTWLRQLVLMIVVTLGCLGTSLLFIFNPIIFISLLIITPAAFFTSFKGFRYQQRQYRRWLEERDAQQSP